MYFCSSIVKLCCAEINIKGQINYGSTSETKHRGSVTKVSMCYNFTSESLEPRRLLSLILDDPTKAI